MLVNEISAFAGKKKKVSGRLQMQIVNSVIYNEFLFLFQYVEEKYFIYLIKVLYSCVASLPRRHAHTMMML